MRWGAQGPQDRARTMGFQRRAQRVSTSPEVLGLSVGPSGISRLLPGMSLANGYKMLGGPNPDDVETEAFRPHALGRFFALSPFSKLTSARWLLRTRKSMDLLPQATRTSTQRLSSGLANAWSARMPGSKSERLAPASAVECR